MTLVCILYALISFNKADRRYMSQNQTLNIKTVAKEVQFKEHLLFLFVCHDIQISYEQSEGLHVQFR